MDDIKPDSHATEQANQYVDACLPSYQGSLTHDVIAQWDDQCHRADADCYTGPVPVVARPCGD